MRKITFSLVTILCLISVTGNHLSGQADPIPEQSITFQSSGASLSGTLLMPNKEQPVPAIVFLHGSGPMTRNGFRPYAEAFAKMGIACLFYDKRGAGTSNGTVNQPLEDLSDDGVAAIEYLKGLPEIDPERIGIWGISQAGWIAPVVARKSGAVNFMIIISGGGASAYESEMFSWQQEFEKAGLTATEQEAATGFFKSYFQYLSTGAGYQQLDQSIRAIEAGHYEGLQTLAPDLSQEFAKILKSILPTEATRNNYAWITNYDPVEDIAAIDFPVLLLFGDQDKDHPTALAVEKWREGFQKAGNSEKSIVLFPGAGHGIRMRAGHTGTGRAPFADGYWEVQLGWLWQNVIHYQPKK